MATGADQERWIAERMRHIESSGIRKVFELARSLKDPVNLSIGQPDFDVPRADQGRRACRHRPRGQRLHRHPGYRRAAHKIHADVHARYRHADRETFITSGTSGGLLLALCCTVNPGDEVIVFDPYFVMYPHLVALAGGTTVYRRYLS